MNPKANCLYIGKAGEYRVASELMLRGYGVLMAIVDNGIDLVTDNNLHIQVKSSKRQVIAPKNNNRSNQYQYSFSLQWHNSYKKKCKLGDTYVLKPHPLMGVDFVICWAIDDNDFFIIPVEKVRGLHGIIVNANKNSRVKYQKNRYLIYRNNWDVLKGIMPEPPKSVDKELVVKMYLEGYTLEKIGKQLDIPETSVRRVVLKAGAMRTKSVSRIMSYKAKHGVDHDVIIKQLYDQGYVLEDIPEKVGLSRRTVWSALKRLGISRNPQQSRKLKKELLSKIENIPDHGGSYLPADTSEHPLLDNPAKEKELVVN